MPLRDAIGLVAKDLPADAGETLGKRTAPVAVGGPDGHLGEEIMPSKEPSLPGILCSRAFLERDEPPGVLGLAVRNDEP